MRTKPMPAATGPLFGSPCKIAVKRFSASSRRWALRAAKAARSSGVRARPEFIRANFGFVFAQAVRNLAVLRMRAEIGAQLGSGGRIGGIPDQRLAKSIARVGIQGMLLRECGCLRSGSAGRR